MKLRAQHKLLRWIIELYTDKQWWIQRGDWQWSDPPNIRVSALFYIHKM